MPFKINIIVGCRNIEIMLAKIERWGVPKITKNKAIETPIKKFVKPYFSPPIEFRIATEIWFKHNGKIATAEAIRYIPASSLLKIKSQISFPRIM